MVLAAGMGTRLKPLTDTTPKVMFPIADKPLLEYHFDLLKKFGVKGIGVNLHCLPEVTKNYFGDGSRFGVNIRYSFEPEILGTAGAVKKLEDFFDEPFLVIYGDMLIEVDYGKLIEFRQARCGWATIAVYHHPEPWTQGILEIDADGWVKSFVEKPPRDKIKSDFANAGIYVLQPDVLQLIPKDTFFDFGNDVFPLMLEKDLPIYACEIKGYVQDIGTPERYTKAQEDVSMGKVWRAKE
jgi:NDP-sugar pyrophosphorylase family protein